MAEVYMPQKKDPLETIVRGLQVAQGVFGIATDWKKLKAMNQAEEDTANQTIGSKEKVELASRGAMQTDDPAQADVKFTERGADGELKPLYFKLPKKETSERPEKYTTVTTDEGVLAVNTADPNDRVRLGARPSSSGDVKQPKNVIGTTGGVSEAQFSAEEKLRRDYDSQAKETRDIVNAYRKIDNIAGSGAQSGASDMSLIYAYMKMVDPGSTVREGEYAQAEQTRSIPSSVVAAYNKAYKGEKLTAEQRGQFISQARSMLNAHLKAQNEADQRTAQIATQYGLDPARIVDPRFAKVAQDLNRSVVGAPPPSAEKPSGLKIPQDKTVAEYAAQYNLPYDRAMKILVNRGYKPNG